MRRSQSSDHRFLSSLKNAPKLERLLKGQCHEIFYFKFFSWIIFPEPTSILCEKKFWFFSTISEDIRNSRSDFIVMYDCRWRIYAGITETNVLGIDVNLPLHFREFPKNGHGAGANGIIRENKPEIKIWWLFPFKQRSLYITSRV